MSRGTSNITLDEVGKAEVVIDHIMKSYALHYMIYRDEMDEEDIDESLKVSLILEGAKEILIQHAMNIICQNYDPD